MKLLFVSLFVLSMTNSNASAFCTVPMHSVQNVLEDQITINYIGNETHRIAWQPISGEGNYTLTIQNLSDQGNIIKTTSNTSADVRGLINGDSYRITVGKAGTSFVIELIVN